MTNWHFLRQSVVYMVHDRQLADHGGSTAVLMPDAITKAVQRPKDLALYNSPDAADLAACYAFWLTRTLGFASCKVGTAWICACTFLACNNIGFSADLLETYELMRSVERGEVTEFDLAGWFRSRIVS